MLLVHGVQSRLKKEDANVVARDCSAAHLENAGGANRAIISTVIALAVMTDW